MKPITKELILQEYSDVFEVVGKFPVGPYKLKLKPNSVPAKHRQRKVPVHFKEAFHKEVARLL